MNATTSKRASDKGAAAAPAGEGEIREFVRREMSTMRRDPDAVEINAEHFNSLVARAAGTSSEEIDNLIAELQAIRDFLVTEGERVQQELASYARASQAALSSAELISQSLSQLKSSAGASSRKGRGSALFDGAQRLARPREHAGGRLRASPGNSY
jgi:hypothetical protein